MAIKDSVKWKEVLRRGWKLFNHHVFQVGVRQEVLLESPVMLGRQCFDIPSCIVKFALVFVAVAVYSEPDGSMLCMFQGQLGGVTHLMFSPDGTRLYSGGRKVEQDLHHILYILNEITMIIVCLFTPNLKVAGPYTST